jgi:hypothetical protein
VLCLLDPKHSLSPDILSYFKQAAAASSTEEDEQAAKVLPQVPVAGLRRRVLGSNKRSAKLSTRSTRSKGSSVKQQAKPKQPQQQPTIITAFAKYQQATEQKEDGEEDELLPDSVLDDLWNFDLSQASTVVNEETKTNNDHSLSDEEDVTESFRTPLEDTVEYTATHISPKGHGTKRHKSTTAHCSSPTTASKNKKAKLSRTSPVTKPLNDQILADYNDPFDELAAYQARKVKSESSAGVPIIKHQWVRIDDDEDIDLEDTMKYTSTSYATITNTYTTGEEEEFDTELDSLASSSSLQQEREYIKPGLTSSLKLSSTASQERNRESIETAPTVKPTSSLEVLNFSTKDIDEMLFGISTPDSDLSPMEFPETEDLSSCSLEFVEHSAPRQARRSASQPAAHCLSEDQEETTSSSWSRAKSCSDPVLEAEFLAKFDDITNTVTSPQKDSATSLQKKSDSVPTRRSIVDLTQTTGVFCVQGLIWCPPPTPLEYQQ